MATEFKVVRRGKQRQKQIGALGATYVLTVPSLPGRRWTYGYNEMRRELMVLADLSEAEARNILFDAYLKG